MSDLRGGLIGCGFFARNHLHAWNEVSGAQIVAVCDLDIDRAAAYAQEFRIPAYYAHANDMLHDEDLDFVDIVTHASTHRELVELVAASGTHVICQKPLAFTLEDCRAMVDVARAAGVRFMAHENFRWQTPMRRLRDASASLGELFFGRITFRTAFEVYASQPYLATDERLIIADLGVHLLDLARFFLGEAERVSCVTRRVNPRIAGEDVATILLQMRSGATCVVELSFASHLDEELFPQTLVHLEGAAGTATLGPHYALTITDASGTRHADAAPRRFGWTTPMMEAIQDSVVAIEQHWADCLHANREPETSGEDNLRTLALVYAAYDAADRGETAAIAD